MKTSFPKIRQGPGIPLTGPEKKVLGFISLLTLLGLGVLFLKSVLGTDNPLWIQPGLKEDALKRPVQSYPVFAPKTNPALGSVDLNRADEKELTRVPKVGPVMAKRIAGYRKKIGAFKKVSQLRNVSGIGPKKLQQISPYFFIPPESGVKK